MGYNNYTAKFKLSVIEFAEEKGNCAAAKHFNVNESHVRYWKKQKSSLQNTKPGRRAFRGPKQGKFPAVEEELLKYVRQMRSSCLAVSCEMLQFEARKIAHEKGIPAAAFKASRGWVTRFMRRHQLSLRRRTTLCQRLPQDYEEKIVLFHRFVIGLRRTGNFIMSQIGNADETPLTFDMPPNTTVSEKGVSSVPIKTTGCEKQRCTVMLAVTADGRKLPPFVIFKRKTVPKMKLGARIHIRAQENGWMNEELMQDWIDTVWGKRPGALLRLPSLLVLDSFKGHLVESVKEKLCDMRTHLAVIPGGLTSVLQPLDVSVNKPFKDYVRKMYVEWMASGEHGLTPTGRIKRPPLETVCEWIVAAWDMVSPSIVEHSFKKTGLSNALDGTEDDALWEGSDGGRDDDSESDFSTSDSD